MFRLVALDVDGTLLDPHHQLRSRVASAVRGAVASGAAVALATGKLLGSIQPLLEEMAIRGPQIVLNGAATLESTTGQVLRFCPLQEVDRRAIITTVRETDPSLLISHFATDTIYVDRAHPMLGIFSEYGEGPPVLVPDLLASGLPAAGKILLSGPTGALATLRRTMEPGLPENITMTSTTPDFLEFFDRSAGKGHALAALREMLGVPKAAVIAIGDGENDLPLLREAGLAIAMANGAAATREAADRIVPSNAEDGVAVILEELIAGGYLSR